ncbi:hypothetical protein EE612_002891 [Oryza sativa]|nr:hypothetical protein EE612_002891 [Oryza sativa]
MGSAGALLSHSPPGLGGFPPRHHHHHRLSVLRCVPLLPPRRPSPSAVATAGTFAAPPSTGSRPGDGASLAARTSEGGVAVGQPRRSPRGPISSTCPKMDLLEVSQRMKNRVACTIFLYPSKELLP